MILDVWEMRRDIYTRACKKLGIAIEPLDAEGYVAHIRDKDAFFITTFFAWPPLNSHSMQQLVKDKIFTKMVLHDAGIQTPKGEHIFISPKGSWVPQKHPLGDVHAVAASIGYPLFVKPHNRSKGRGAQIVRSEAELTKALENVALWAHAALLEEVQEGREGRLMCIDGKPEFLYYREPNPDTGIGNVSAGGTVVGITTRDIPPSIVAIGKRIFEVFGGDLRLYAVDFFEDADGSITVLEVNSRPHMQGIYTFGSPEMASTVMEHALETYFNKRV